MIFHYAGQYDGDENKLPQREHPEGYVPFKEPRNMNLLALVVTGISVGLTIILFVLLRVRAGYIVFDAIGVLLSLVCMVPHEWIHALFFRKDVYMYQNLAQGMLFVCGNEDMSKARFIWMSLGPNIVFGFIPFMAFMINPSLEMLGTLGAFSIGAGAGDYLNVFNAATQMPKKAKTYLSGMHSFWYL